MNYSLLDDTSLVTLIAQENSDAMSELYNRYSRLVYNLALNIIGDRSTSEEITLDVFVAVWEKAQTYQADRAKVTTWLTSITRYRAIDRLRQRSSRSKHHNVTWAEASFNNRLKVDGPEETIELSLQRDHIRFAVDQLPANQKEVLALAYFKGYTHSEIAEVLEQPLGTVKTRIRLAMKKLRHALQNEQLRV